MRAPTPTEQLASGGLHCLGLTKAFRRTRVLDGLTLDLSPGDRVALIGSNGAGKTTLIRCLLGEYEYEGEVRIGGLDPRRDRASLLARVGFVPQLPPPLRMPVGRLLEFAAAVCGTDPARMAAMAARLGLETGPIADRPFARLSGGMKQKILIAIALGRDADLLLMDEPAANLDPAARQAFFELLSERAGRATMLISSHRLDEVATLVNRVVELDAGRVALDDLVAGDDALGVLLHCRLSLLRPEPMLALALSAWGLEAAADALTWEGRIAAADRMRFVGTLTRYMGAVGSLSLREADA